MKQNPSEEFNTEFYSLYSCLLCWSCQDPTSLLMAFDGDPGAAEHCAKNLHARLLRPVLFLSSDQCDNVHESGVCEGTRNTQLLLEITMAFSASQTTPTFRPPVLPHRRLKSREPKALSSALGSSLLDLARTSETSRKSTRCANQKCACKTNIISRIQPTYYPLLSDRDKPHQGRRAARPTAWCAWL